MKHITRDQFITINDKRLEINNDPNEGHACYIEILKRTEEQSTAFLSHHNRMLLLLGELHVTQYTPDNKILSAFLRS